MTEPEYRTMVERLLKHAIAESGMEEKMAWFLILCIVRELAGKHLAKQD